MKSEKQIRETADPGWIPWSQAVLKAISRSGLTIEDDLNRRLLAGGDSSVLQRRLLWWMSRNMSSHNGGMSFDSFFAQPAHHRVAAVTPHGKRLRNLFVLTDEELDGLLCYAGVSAALGLKIPKGEAATSFLQALDAAEISYTLTKKPDQKGVIELPNHQWTFWPVKGNWEKVVTTPKRVNVGVGAGALAKSVRRALNRLKNE